VISRHNVIIIIVASYFFYVIALFLSWKARCPCKAEITINFAYVFNKMVGILTSFN